MKKIGATESKTEVFHSVTLKKGATDWTVGKLLAIIMAVVLLALIIYGFSTGAINPLKERIVGMWDNVLSLFGRGSGGGGDCYVGKNILVYESEDGNKIYGDMTFCPDECKVDLKDEQGSYRINFENGHLQSYSVLYIYSSGEEPVLDEAYITVEDVALRFNNVFEIWEWSPHGDLLAYSSYGDNLWASVDKDMQKAPSGENFEVRDSVIRGILENLKEKNFTEGKEFLGERRIQIVRKNWNDIDSDAYSSSEEVEQLREIYHPLLAIKGGKEELSQIKINFEGQEYESWFDEYAGLAIKLGETECYAYGRLSSSQDNFKLFKGDCSSFEKDGGVKIDDANKERMTALAVAFMNTLHDTKIEYSGITKGLEVSTFVRESDKKEIAVLSLYHGNNYAVDDWEYLWKFDKGWERIDSFDDGYIYISEETFEKLKLNGEIKKFLQEECR